MNVAEPVYGRLLSGGVHPAGDPIVVSELIHPRVEPEIVFVMGDGLRGPGVSAAEVLAATRAVCCGLEIIDSRYADFSFTAADVIADNTSAARRARPEPGGSRAIGPGPRRPAPGGGWRHRGHRSPGPHHGSSGRCGGDVGELARRPWRVDPARWTFSGGLTAAVPLEPGSAVTATFGHLGSVTVRGI